MQSNQHICCIVSHVAELASIFLFHCLFLYIVLCCVLLPPFPPHSLLPLRTFTLSYRLRRCKTDMNASISTMQLLMLFSWDIEQGRQIFPYQLTLCKRIWAVSIISSRLYLWASQFPSSFSWALQFTAEQRRGKRKYIQKEGSNVQLSFMVMTSISWVLFMTQFDCHGFYGFIEICMLQLMQKVYSLKQCQGLATEIILNLW